MGITEIVLLVCYALYMAFTCVVNIVTYRRTGKVRNLVSSLQAVTASQDLETASQDLEADEDDSFYLYKFYQLSEELQKSGISLKRLCEVLEKCKSEVK